jgi:hypothetical protein
MAIKLTKLKIKTQLKNSGIEKHIERQVTKKGHKLNLN